MPGWLKKGTERITSAKWWNRKSQPTFSQWNTDLTIIYGQKYLYEPSKFHLASWGMPGEHRVKNSHIWTGNKNNFTLPTSLNIFIHFYPSSKPEQISARRECPGLWHSSSGGGKRTVMYSMLQLFRGLPKRPVSTSLHLEALKELELCRCLGTAEKKEEWWVACCGWHGSAWSGKNTNLEASPTGGREKNGGCIQHPSFSKGWLREWYQSWPRMMTRNKHGYLVATENKGEQGNL